MQQIIRRNTFRTFHQGVDVTLSLLQVEGQFVVRCQPRGYPLKDIYDTRCPSRAAAEAVYTEKYSIGMVGTA